uniref:Uncharacterized protein n=1 Tax=Oncorhynchus kisutch TaxID=8019 RepID=A0A8C7J038_ONCKI
LPQNNDTKEENIETVIRLQKIFTYGPMYLGSNGALVGLIANRRFTSNLPMAILPFLTTVAMYDVAWKPIFLNSGMFN